MTSPKSQKSIAIAGGGIAGLTAALCLERAGFRVDVFERSDAPVATGTGIQISPNAGKILESLDLGPKLDAVADQPEAINIHDGFSGSFLARFELGKAFTNRHGAPYRVIYRADLLALLSDACAERADIAIHSGCAATGMDLSKTILQIERNGREASNDAFEADAFIAADGAWSKLRGLVDGSAEPQFSGSIAWRAVAPVEAVPSFVSRTATGLWLGPDAHVVHYPVRQGTAVNVIAITRWTEKGEPPHRWMDERQPAFLTDAFANWCGPVRELIRIEAEWGGWPIHAAKRAREMAKGKLCLIGDAAHPMVPFAAQGGAAAIEDAAVLAQCCAKSPDDLANAFAYYAKARRSRVQRVMDLSANNRRIYHLPRPLSLARNLAMKFAPQEAMQRRMDWLYGWQAR